VPAVVQLLVSQGLLLRVPLLALRRAALKVSLQRAFLNRVRLTLYLPYLFVSRVRSA
jgi:hypothetical protein